MLIVRNELKAFKSNQFQFHILKTILMFIFNGLFDVCKNKVVDQRGYFSKVFTTCSEADNLLFTMPRA